LNNQPGQTEMIVDEFGSEIQDQEMKEKDEHDGHQII